MKKAIAEFDRSIRMSNEPSSQSACYYQRGLARYELENFENAIGDLDQAIAGDPEFGEAYYYRGRAHHELAHTGRALADYNQAVSHLADGSEKAMAHSKRAAIYSDQGKLKEAIMSWEYALK